MTEPDVRGAEPASPCLGVCTMDAATRLCMGCYRSLGEIAAWPRLSARAKQGLLEALAAREARLGRFRVRPRRR